MFIVLLFFLCSLSFFLFLSLFSRFDRGIHSIIFSCFMTSFSPYQDLLFDFVRNQVYSLFGFICLYSQRFFDLGNPADCGYYVDSWP